MAKDPAFLFYSSDFLNGVSDLTMEERGQYITLLCLQHQKGSLSNKTIRLSVGNVSVDVMKKFSKDNEGNFYQERLSEEIEKRLAFTESRRNNGVKGGRPKASGYPNGYPKTNLMENESENVIVNENLNKGGAGGNLIDVFFNDLPNSKEFENIAIRLQIGKDDLMHFVKDFRIKAELTYPNFQRFCSHFKNFVTKKIEENVKQSTYQNGSGNKDSAKASVIALGEATRRRIEERNRTFSQAGNTE